MLIECGIAPLKHVETNKKLLTEGIEMLPIPSSELGGGSCCMTYPLERV